LGFDVVLTAAGRETHRSGGAGAWDAPAPGTAEPMSIEERVGGRSALVPLIAGVALLGIADSMIGPYLVLFGTDRARLTPLQVGVFLSVISVSGMALSTWLGHRYDRSPSRWPAFVAVAAPAAGYLALATTTRYPLLLLIGAGLLGAGLAAFPQVFTLARTHLGGAASGRSTPALRSVWSLAWAVGPVLGGLALTRTGYDGLLTVTALAFAGVALPLALLGRTPSGARPTASPAPAVVLTRPMLLAAGAFTMFHTAMLSGSVVLPLYVTRTLERPDGDVGLLFSVCALVEIPVALSLMLLSSRRRQRRLIQLGMLLLAAYFVLLAAGSTMAVAAGSQVARGAGIALVGALGITYMQDLLPQAPGRATTLFANTLTAGSLVSGVLAGAAAQALGYRAALLLCGGLAAAGWALLATARPDR
jgi:SET family sugar efflux transporter-like MFS transporter